MTEPPQGPPTGAEQAGRVGDRYEVGGLLGRGGMADVRVGRDMRLGRTVAIKRLRNDLATDPTFQARFRREAQSAASLNHPAIVAVYDTGEEIGPDGQAVPYIVMELVEGQTLRDIMREDRKILPQRSLDIVADVLNALDYSHRAGIVHRDIKPANVMLTPAGQVKVMDFGIARAIADSSSAMTQTAAVVGTAQYLSPEQARGEQVDARSDLYSTGCLLYELLTGRPPFVGDSPVSVAYQHVREEPPPPSTINPEITPGMDAVVLRSLAKRTEDRYQSAAEMRADIERVLAGMEVAAPAVPAAAAVAQQQAAPVQDDATSTMAATPGRPDEPVYEERKRRKWPWILVILLVLGIIGGAAYATRDQWMPASNGAADEPETVTVPKVATQPPKVANNKLRNAGLEPAADRERQFSPTVDEDLVMGTDPGEGDSVEKGDTVTLIISKGEKPVRVPRVAGDPVDKASKKIQQAGLFVQREQARGSNKPEGTVSHMSPSGGEKVKPDTTVTVYVSTGYKNVPDVVDRKQKIAERMLSKRGFENITIEEDSKSTDPAGTVIEQSPGAGKRVDPQKLVTLTVSTGEGSNDGGGNNDNNDGGGDNNGGNDGNNNGNNDSSDNPSDGSTDGSTNDPSDEPSEPSDSPSTDGGLGDVLRLGRDE